MIVPQETIPSDEGDIRAVVFDVGGVLVDWHPAYLYNRMFDDAETMDWFLASICTSAWNRRQCEGRSVADAVVALAREHPEWTQEILAFSSRAGEMVKGAIAGTVGILADLKERGVPLYALTNYPADTFPIARARFDFFRWFEGILVSGEDKLAKPDPAIYRLLIDRYGLEPSTTLFVDDHQANVEAARGVGLQAWHFDVPAGLRAHLTSRGVIR